MNSEEVAPPVGHLKGRPKATASLSWVLTRLLSIRCLNCNYVDGLDCKASDYTQIF